jgi:hypothetical protein
MNENPSIPSPLHTDSQARQELCMVGSERASQVESAGPQRIAAPADRGDEIREIAVNLERLCIEYACHSRINGVGSETRAAWSAFKAQIERLKGVA